MPAEHTTAAPLLPLLCHPASPGPAVASIDAGIASVDGGRVIFRYCLRGDMARIRVPITQAPDRTDQLWEHTCFEAFVGVAGQTAYREFNFSPSGHWAAYDFGDYRLRLADPAIPAPLISTRQTEGRLELEAVVPLTSLPSVPAGGAWEIGLSAVVEAADTIDGGHSYWALRHPSPRPDFHLRSAFTLHGAAD